jgi:hypothetical protein
MSRDDALADVLGRFPIDLDPVSSFMKVETS